MPKRVSSQQGGMGSQLAGLVLLELRELRAIQAAISHTLTPKCAHTHTHTCMHVYVAAHSLHLLCAVPQHNMLVLVYSFLTVCCNGCSACCPTRGISLFIRHAVVSLCLSLAPPCYGASNQPGSSRAVGYTFGGMLLWCQWELIDKSRSLSQLPMSCLSAGKKKIEIEWETDREDEYPALMNRSVRREIRLLSMFEHIRLVTVSLNASSRRSRCWLDMCRLGPYEIRILF